MPPVHFPQPLIPGTLIQRYKRFLADVRLDTGETVTAHCANSGSMLGCKEPGSRVLLTHVADPKRKLPYTWELVQIGETWVGINTAWPNKLAMEAIQSGVVTELAGYPTIKPEQKYGHNSRIDLLLQGPTGTCYVEVKNVTLADGTAAAFPDAVTERGTKHLRELTQMVREGHRAVMLYVVQREDCQRFRPADTIDPVYGQTLREACQLGVEAYAYRCRVGPDEIRLETPLPVQL